jgi:DNA polymerase I-like protein with 3'-5' exonuclease and polymerase domains
VLTLELPETDTLSFETVREKTDTLSPLYRTPVEVAKGVIRHVTIGYCTTKAGLWEIQEWLKTAKVVALDLETSGLSPWLDKIATVQLGVLDHPSGVDVWVLDIRCFTFQELKWLWDLCENKKVVKLGQNLGFEYRFLRMLNVRLRGVADCQLAELVLRAGVLDDGKKNEADDGASRAAYRLTSMKALMLRYYQVVIKKETDVRTSFYSTPAGKHTPVQLAYASLDVVYPFLIAAAQKPIIAERGLREIIKLEMETLPIIHEMEHKGIRLDAGAWRALWQEAVQKRAETERALDDLLRDLTYQHDLFDTDRSKARPIYPVKNKPLNYSSSVQVKWAINAYCKSIKWPYELLLTWPAVKKAKKAWGKEWAGYKKSKGIEVEAEDAPDSVLPEDRYCLLVEADKKALTIRSARGQLPRNLVTLLMDYSKYDQQVTAFGIEWLNKNVRRETKRIHTSVHQAITTTGRTSTQPNLQNIPSDPRYRKCFVPGPGYSFVIADYSQQEPRLLAQVSQDPTYLSTYRNKDDLYVAVAEAMVGHRPDKKTPEGNLERQVFKAIVLAMAYRSGIPKLRDQLTLGLADAIFKGEAVPPTMDYAAEMHRRFFEVHEKVKAFQDRCSNGADPENKEAFRFWDDYLQDHVTFVRAPCGRIRTFRPDANNTYTEAANAPIQGGSASMIKAAACLWQREVDARGWQDLTWIGNIIHDEILCEARNDIAQDVADLLKECMERAGRAYCPDVPVVAEFPESSTGVVPYWTKALK